MPDNSPRPPGSSAVPGISRFRSIIMADAVYLSGHPEMPLASLPIRLHVGDLAVIMVVLESCPGTISWPSATVFDLFKVRAFGPRSTGAGEATPTPDGPTRAGGATVSFLLLAVGGELLDVRIGFADCDAAHWFVRRARMTLNLNI